MTALLNVASAIVRSLNKIEKIVYFPNEKTCPYAENLSAFGEFGLRSKAVI